MNADEHGFEDMVSWLAKAVTAEQFSSMSFCGGWVLGIGVVPEWIDVVREPTIANGASAMKVWSFHTRPTQASAGLVSNDHHFA